MVTAKCESAALAGSNPEGASGGVSCETAELSWGLLWDTTQDY